MIPARLIRTVPADTSADVERYWQSALGLHRHWSAVTFRDPIDPDLFPLTGPYWHRCTTGAQLAGLVRLEALWGLGGIYIDSDVELVRPLDALLTLDCFAAWEDARTVPDAVIGARRRHPAIRACIDLALARLTSGSSDWRTGDGAWATGPGVTTTVLPFADGVTLFGPEAFYPVHYTAKDRLDSFDPTDHPDTFGIHRWHGSWLEEGA